MTARSTEYASENPDLGFAIFMDKVDRLIIARTGMSVFDFADAMWADLYEDSGRCWPGDATAFETLADADELFGAMLEGG